jgi:transposase
MEGTSQTCSIPELAQLPAHLDEGQRTPFSQEWITITKQEHIDLEARANYWEALQRRTKSQLEEARQEIIRQQAKIKDLQNRVFGKKSEKNGANGSKKGNGTSNQDTTTSSNRSRGQQQGSKGHGRTDRSNLPVAHEECDLTDAQKICLDCGLPHQRNAALDEQCDIIEVEVSAYTRRIKRPAYTRHPSCCCDNTPTIIIAPPPPRVIPRGNFGTSFWVEVILGKYRYGQPSNRYLTDLSDQGLPVSPGTLAGGLQKLAPLFDPVMEALYLKQMSEQLFHNDETRWEVFVQIEGKVGSRWYLWVTRSESVVYYCIDPSRSTAVPGAHFAGLQNDRVIIVCDRYSAYKKLARLCDAILLAFCWAHVRRDFLDAGRSFKALEPWMLIWKERIGLLYHLNHLRLEHWDAELPLNAQSADFHQHHQALEVHLQIMYDEAQQVVTRVRDDNIAAGRKETSLVGIKSSAEKQQIKVYRSLLNHWQGLILFMQNPQVPLDNNIAENSIRGSVMGRNAYYGSGSVWSAELAAALFSILQTLGLWGINPRHWLCSYLDACAENGGKAPDNIESFIPWQMDPLRRAALSCPAPVKHPEPP